MVATELREGDGRLPGGTEVDKPAVMKQIQSLGREGKQDSLGRPYSDCRLAIELLHSAARQLPGSREASTAPGSGLPLRAAAREDPTRAPAALPAGPTPQRCRGVCSRPRPPVCGTLHVFFLRGLDHTSGKPAPGAAYPQRNLLARSGAAGDSPTRGREKAPGDGGSGGGAAARAPAGVATVG